MKTRVIAVIRRTRPPQMDSAVAISAGLWASAVSVKLAIHGE